MTGKETNTECSEWQLMRRPKATSFKNLMISNTESAISESMFPLERVRFLRLREHRFSKMGSFALVMPRLSLSRSAQGSNTTCVWLTKWPSHKMIEGASGVEGLSTTKAKVLGVKEYPRMRAMPRAAGCWRYEWAPDSSFAHPTGPEDLSCWDLCIASHTPTLVLVLVLFLIRIVMLILSFIFVRCIWPEFPCTDAHVDF